MMLMNYNRPRTYKRRTTTSRKTNWPSYRTNPKMRSGLNWQYGPVRTNLQNKINAYRTLYAQCNVTGPYKPSPTTINKFANYVNKGYMLHKISGTQIAKWDKKHNPSWTITWATKCLKAKYGAAIKALFPTGNGRTYMVATSPTWKGKPFKFPTR